MIAIFRKSVGLLCLCASTATVLGDTYLVTTTADSGAGSLRAAIHQANFHLNNSATEPDVIRFRIRGAGVHRISPLTPLPEITDPLIINGYSQPGSAPNTEAYANNAILLIELNGAKCEYRGLPPGIAQKGLTLKASTTVRGLVINRWRGYAIAALGETQQYLIEGNFIGTDPTGMAARFNGSALISYGQTIVGGLSPASRNILSGNHENLGIWGGFATVQGNFIGPDATGASSVKNTGTGIYFSDYGNARIGGVEPEAANVISGNDAQGIYLGCWNVPEIVGNRIGTDATGTKPLGNQIGINANLGGRIGMMHDGATPIRVANRIAFNRGAAISVARGRNDRIGVTITQNRIYGNGGLGIDLDANGVTVNDQGDADIGANGLQNFPLLSSAAVDQDHIVITGSLNSHPNMNYRVEFFGSRGVKPNGLAEGRSFLGATTVRTRGFGNGTINVRLPFTAKRLKWVTATATNADGSTSEFSTAVQIARPGGAATTQIEHAVDAD